jgi:hypothetical protein
MPFQKMKPNLNSPKISVTPIVCDTIRIGRSRIDRIEIMVRVKEAISTSEIGPAGDRFEEILRDALPLSKLQWTAHITNRLLAWSNYLAGGGLFDFGSAGTLQRSIRRAFDRDCNARALKKLSPSRH